MDWEVYAGSSYDFQVINPSAGVTETISLKDGKASKLYQSFFEDDFDPEYFDPDNVFFTAGSGNPTLPMDLTDRLMKILKKL